MGIAHTDRFPPASISVNLPYPYEVSADIQPGKRGEGERKGEREREWSRGAISKMFPLIENGPIPPTLVPGAESCR